MASGPSREAEIEAVLDQVWRLTAQRTGLDMPPWTGHDPATLPAATAPATMAARSVRSQRAKITPVDASRAEPDPTPAPEPSTPPIPPSAWNASSDLDPLPPRESSPAPEGPAPSPEASFVSVRSQTEAPAGTSSADAEPEPEPLEEPPAVDIRPVDPVRRESSSPFTSGRPEPWVERPSPLEFDPTEPDPFYEGIVGGDKVDPDVPPGPEPDLAPIDPENLPPLKLDRSTMAEPLEPEAPPAPSTPELRVVDEDPGSEAKDDASGTGEDAPPAEAEPPAPQPEEASTPPAEPQDEAPTVEADESAAESEEDEAPAAPPAAAPAAALLLTPDRRVAGPNDTPRRGPLEPEPAGPMGETEPDEEVLRALVQKIVREELRAELRGDLGLGLTRTVRKLVRQEVNRVLAAQEIG